jgi:hypothetical protein
MDLADDLDYSGLAVMSPSFGLQGTDYLLPAPMGMQVPEKSYGDSFFTPAGWAAGSFIGSALAGGVVSLLINAAILAGLLYGGYWAYQRYFK